MSSFYILCPPTPCSWQLDPGQFARDLQSRWPEAKIARADGPVNAITWEIAASSHSWLDGSLQLDGQTSCLRGDPELIADYVLWLRAHNPEPDLVLVHDAYGTLNAIAPNTTREQIIALL
ncbi:MAG: hypothetical protein WBH47_05205 [Streptosporangiaceae bacterium]